MTIPEMDSVSQNPMYSDDPETKGFDLSSAKSWIYPENYPIRDYQYSIVETALYNNTLVCLPTGLGKTFIAAVLMYNYWRWYPRGKIIFLAPTRPLVAQQIVACHNVMGIPTTETIELTGSTNQREREIQWSQRRVIFATPQVFHNDLNKNIVPSDLIKCVVIDEAHKALGKHSYCECIQILSTQNQYFRILALSATPGNKIDKVHEVVQNLHISQIELRDETSHDIKPYINERKLDIILVPLSKELAEFKERYLNIIDPHVKYLYQNKILTAQTANISKGRIFYMLRDFKNSSSKPNNYGQIITKLNILLTMYHAYELMVRHGLRAFIKFYENHSDKFWMNSEFELQNLLNDIQAYLGPFPDVQLLPDGQIPEVPKDIKFGHNKFYKLNELLIRHFKNRNENQDTRAIVFVEYKDIVNEVYVLLLQLRPLIRPQMFVGQSGQKQRLQIKALENFRNNVVNVLISTSIGEEGLDVGEVDLIICFDISQQSPTRLVQRMGRTGRKRDGHIIALVTDGKEHEAFKSTMRKRDSLNNKILHTSNITSSLYEHNPRMIPEKFTPECHKRIIVVEQEAPVEKRKGGRKKKAADKKLQGQSTLQKHLTNVKKKPDSKSQQDDVQPSMSKFLKHTESSEAPPDNNNIRTLLTSQPRDNIRNTIKPSNVKLLSSDNDAIDFLTLCAIKKSEKEASQEASKKIDMTFMPSPCSSETEDIFDFSIPDKKILDCLSSLDQETIQLSGENENNAVSDVDVNNGMDDMAELVLCDAYENWASPVDNDIPTNSKSEINERLTKSRFEDLLDETSDSDKTTVDEDDNQKPERFEKHFEVSNGECSSADQILGEMDLDFDEVLHDIPESNEGFTAVSEERPPSMGPKDKNEAIYEDLFKDTDDENDDEVTIVEEVEVEGKNGYQGKQSDNSTFNSSYNKLHEEKNCQSSYKKEYTNFNDLEMRRIETENTNKNARKSEEIIDNRTVVSEQEDNNTFESIFGDKIKSLSESVNDMDLSESCSQRVNDAKQINTLIRQHFSKTQSPLAECTNSPQKSDNMAFEESEDDMFAMDCDALEMQLDSIEKRFAEGHNNDSVKVLDVSTDVNPVDTTKNECNTQSELVKANKCDDIKDEGIDFDNIEWNSDFESPSSPVNKPSTSFIYPKSSPESPIVKLGKKKEENSSKWISANTKNSSRENDRPKLAQKLSKLRKSLTSNVRPAQKSWFDSDDDDFANDFVINNDDVKKINELESSFFAAKKESDGTNERSDSAFSLNRSTNRQPVKNDLSVFKAPTKYFKSNHNSTSTLENRGQNQGHTNDRISGNSSTARVENASSHRRRVDSEKKVDSKKKQRNRLKSNFIDDEADVSGVASTDESSGSDEDLDDFVSYTQHVPEEVDMQAHYLQAIRSPLKKPGAFIIRKPSSPDHEIDLYSQPVSQEHDTYLYDSFCVDGDEETFEESKQHFGYSILEEAERALKNKRKRRDSMESNGSGKSKTKKRATAKLLNTSVSSEDEMEKLRREIQNESVILKGLST